MTSPRAPFAALVDRLRARDPDAAAQVFHQFAGRLLGLAASRLGRLLRPKAEPEDVVQSAFKSFFARQAQFELHDWDGLWDILVVITLRKCCNRAEHFRAACRDVRREVPIRAGAPADLLHQVEAREPTPEDAAELAETVEQLLDAFRERERDILALSLQGYAVAEIGAQLGCSERKVYRVRERVREELRRLQGAAGREVA